MTAGHIIMPLAAEHKVPILPVDSEHSAVFQSMNGDNKERDGFGRALQGQNEGGTEGHQSGRRPAASQLGHGEENYH